jgi:hypothetical protein
MKVNYDWPLCIKQQRDFNKKYLGFTLLLYDTAFQLDPPLCCITQSGITELSKIENIWSNTKANRK